MFLRFEYLINTIPDLFNRRIVSREISTSTWMMNVIDLNGGFVGSYNLLATIWKRIKEKINRILTDIRVRKCNYLIRQ